MWDIEGFQYLGDNVFGWTFIKQCSTAEEAIEYLTKAEPDDQFSAFQAYSYRTHKAYILEELKKMIGVPKHEVCLASYVPVVDLQKLRTPDC